MEPIVIDGSQGEGGGQVLRTALALSVVTRTPFRMERIRAKRSSPGLRRQHVTAVKAAAAICGAEVRGADLGSTEIAFGPGRVAPGAYDFAVGTAGSACLVLQTVLPPLLTAPGPSVLTLEGGTHNPAAPPFDFLAKAFLPLVGRMGPRVEAALERYGFFPAGGGRFTVRIEPAARLARVDLRERGEVTARRARVLIANLPRAIAEREAAVLAATLDWPASADYAIEVIEGVPGPGNVVMAEVVAEHVTELFTGFGQPGVRAEAVAAGVAHACRAWLAAGVPVGEHLADQLLVPMALAGRGSFRTLPLSLHTTTNIEVVRRFLDVPIRATTAESGTVLVEVGQVGA